MQRTLILLLSAAGLGALVWLLGLASDPKVSERAPPRGVETDPGERDSVDPADVPDVAGRSVESAGAAARGTTKPVAAERTPVRATELLESLGLEESLLADLRIAPVNMTDGQLGSIRAALVGKDVGRAALMEALEDPAATARQRSLLVLATIWAQDDTERSLTEVLDPIDFGALGAEGTMDESPESRAAREHSTQFAFATALALRGVEEPGAVDHVLGELPTELAAAAATGISAEGHLIKHLLVASTPEDQRALAIARALVADGERTHTESAAWAAIAKGSPSEAVAQALTFEPAARDGLVLAASAVMAAGQSAALTALLSVDVLDVRSGHYADRGTRALLAASDEGTIADLFAALETADKKKAQWIQRGIERATSCTALGDVLVRLAADPDPRAEGINPAQLRFLTGRVEERLLQGAMTRSEEAATLGSIASAARDLPVESEERTLAIRMLSSSMDPGHRALARDLGQ